MTAQIIEIQPFRSGWQVRGVDGTASLPFFTGPPAIEHAIDHAREGIRHRAGEIRLLDRNGEVITAMPFGESREVPPPVDSLQSPLRLHQAVCDTATIAGTRKQRRDVAGGAVGSVVSNPDRLAT